MIDEYSLGLLENAAKKEGIEEGIEKGVLLVATKLIAANQLSIEQISEVTGMQIDIIKKISLEQQLP